MMLQLIFWLFLVITNVLFVIYTDKLIKGLRAEVDFLQKVRANQAHYIACLQSEVSQLKEKM